MAEVKDTSQKDVEKKFKDVFERSPGPFPEGTSLEEKVNYIAEGTKALKATKGKELENKMENIARLNKELENRQRQNDEEIDKLRRSTQELRKEFGISEKSRLGSSDKSLQEAGQDVQIEGKSFKQSGQKKTSEASAQTDEQTKTSLGHGSVSENAVDILGGATTEDKNFEQQKTSVQMPSEHNVASLLGRNPTREKSDNKKPEPDKKDNAPQENKKEGFFSLLKRFVKKILEKLLGEDEKSVENNNDTKEATQKNTSNNEVQQKSKLFDEILSQDQSIGEGLEQATRLESPVVTPVNTPEVKKANTGREI